MSPDWLCLNLGFLRSRPWVRGGLKSQQLIWEAIPGSTCKGAGGTDVAPATGISERSPAGSWGLVLLQSQSLASYSHSCPLWMRAAAGTLLSTMHMLLWPQAQAVKVTDPQTWALWECGIDRVCCINYYRYCKRESIYWVPRVTLVTFGRELNQGLWGTSSCQLLKFKVRHRRQVFTLIRHRTGCLERVHQGKRLPTLRLPLKELTVEGDKFFLEGGTVWLVCQVPSPYLASRILAGSTSLSKSPLWRQNL